MSSILSIPKPPDHYGCERCGQRYKVRVSPGEWETLLCGCGCLIKYWTKDSEVNRRIVNLLHTVEYSKTTFVPSWAHKRMAYVDDVQEKQLTKAEQLFGKK